MANLSERLLRWLLAVSGVVMMTAFVAMLMPVGWMAWAERRLGFGGFPGAPLAEYLARLTSGLYGVLGLLLLLCATDVRRYWALARVLAVGIAGTSTISLVMAWGKIPAYWLLGDVISAGGMAVGVFVLQRLAGGDKSGNGG